ncbi:MAG: bifunctional DNA-formamidopyrimidine glycosylase/DNA-(apurinic or apyrimidinic site) lyase [Deltaproteobacteria bacterium]|nr:bifunctional DNA-formamidopyrimidine glycosylase/DNA-(apurinic or apyrimidinic site) lyase [Deltaproteobacteria bacterium]
MPELPEVETLCRQLRHKIVGSEIAEMRIIDPKLGIIEGLEGKTVRGIRRHGKTLAIELEENRALVLHLRMTGRLLWHNGHGLQPHTRLVISFVPGRISLIDPRRFATATVRQTDDRISLGSDPLDAFDPSHLWKIAQQCTIPIKSFLMDQRRIAGIGNIYACEILHQARLDPWRKANGLSRDEWATLGAAAQEILQRAIANRGTSISDWRDLFGKKGEHQDCLSVYGRGDTACHSCGEKIQRRKLNGRGTYFCPTCQQRKGGAYDGTMEL